MKKLLFSVAFLSAFFASETFAKETKTIFNETTALVLSEESHDYIKSALDTAIVYTNPAKLYGVHKIQIFNPSKDSVLILDDKGRVVTKTNDSIVIEVPEGNYWILSNSKKVRTEVRID